MKKFMILFLIGADRPGIVDEMSSYLFERGANIEDSRMATMGGRFSAMTLFSCGAEGLNAIERDLDQLRAHGFETSLHEAQDPTTLPSRVELPLKIDVMAVDHPGIVRNIVHILHTHNVNILSLNTEVIRAPLSGAPLFDLTLEAAVPAEQPVTRIKDELTKLAADLNLDLTFGR